MTRAGDESPGVHGSKSYRWPTHLSSTHNGGQVEAKGSGDAQAEAPPVDRAPPEEAPVAPDTGTACTETTSSGHPGLGTSAAATTGEHEEVSAGPSGLGSPAEDDVPGSDG